MNLNSWVLEWLYTYKKILVKRSTFDSYITYASNVSCDKDIRELSALDIQKMINSMVADGKQLSTVKHMVTIVRQSLKKAFSLGMINNLSMLDGLELPRNRQKKICSLTRGQVDLLLDNADAFPNGDFYLALLFTGCRVGELIALRWCDVDFFNSEIHIRHTDYHGDLLDVKTAHGMRTIPIFAHLKKILSRRSPNTAACDRVFLNARGEPLKYRAILDDWHYFTSQIGFFEPPGFHVLRHTFAHTALRAGIPVKVVSAWLGHADVGITLRIYDCVDDNDMKMAARTLENLYNSSAGGLSAPRGSSGGRTMSYFTRSAE